MTAWIMQSIDGRKNFATSALHITKFELAVQRIAKKSE